ncbi:hypothetical protein LNQ03_08550 [Klebsiella pneumoniae subsp. pneumoniae]|nr:hypothetical protein [Klebsiella pneumoniae subsp. pneumoniae]
MKFYNGGCPLAAQDLSSKRISHVMHELAAGWREETPDRSICWRPAPKLLIHPDLLNKKAP